MISALAGVFASFFDDMLLRCQSYLLSLYFHHDERGFKEGIPAQQRGDWKRMAEDCFHDQLMAGALRLLYGEAG